MPTAAGNAQFEPTTSGPISAIIPEAAERVIVTARRSSTTEVLRRNPDRTVLPGFMVDAVVEVPYGAHPTSFNPRYGYDTRLHLAWGKAAREDDDRAGVPRPLRAQARRPGRRTSTRSAAPRPSPRISRWDVNP